MKTLIIKPASLERIASHEATDNKDDSWPTNNILVGKLSIEPIIHKFV